MSDRLAEPEGMVSNLKPWNVVSPEYGTVIPILDDGTGPMEYGCDVVGVWAETKRDALVLGVKLFRKMGAKYLDDSYVSPFAGVRVLEAACEHGTPMFPESHDCERCLAEFKAQDILLGVDY